MPRGLSCRMCLKGCCSKGWASATEQPRHRGLPQGSSLTLWPQMPQTPFTTLTEPASALKRSSRVQSSESGPTIGGERPTSLETDRLLPRVALAAALGWAGVASCRSSSLEGTLSASGEPCSLSWGGVSSSLGASDRCSRTVKSKARAMPPACMDGRSLGVWQFVFRFLERRTPTPGTGCTTRFSGRASGAGPCSQSRSGTARRAATRGHSVTAAPAARRRSRLLEKCAKT
mmetsp:Transcript_84006/g.271868  ORF Transcript_84006/g.271868 Transcript_84006/m.271868 type:complete len:231 (+) Transcript_84006:261-953(+)